MKLLAVAILVLALLTLGTESKHNKVHLKKEKWKKWTTIQPERRTQMQSVKSAGYCADGYFLCVAGVNPAVYRYGPYNQPICLSHYWVCETTPIVCDCADCADEHCVNGSPTTATTTTTTTAAITTTTASGGSGQCGQSAPIHPPALSILGGEIMGLTYSIVGGDEATPNSYPWMVRLRMQSQTGGLYECGGSLISNQWILTAAHCVYDNGDVTLLVQGTALLGAHNTRFNNDWRAIDNVVPHPYFKIQDPAYSNGVLVGMSTMDNDVALLRLSAPVVFNDRIKPICLPDATSDYRLFQGKVVAAGWGGTDPYMKPSPQSDVLKHLVHSVVGCDTVNQNLSPMRMCAASTGVPGSICEGDSGGPLAALVGGRFTQIGVVSYGPHDCVEGYTNTYAHVPNMREWIRQETGV